MDFEYNSSDTQFFFNPESALSYSNVESDLKINMYNTSSSELVFHNKNQIQEEEEEDNYPNKPLLSLNEFSTLKLNNISYNTESLIFQTDDETSQQLFNESFEDKKSQDNLDISMHYNNEDNLSVLQNSGIENVDYQFYNQLTLNSQGNTKIRKSENNFLMKNSPIDNSVFNNLSVNTEQKIESDNQANQTSENINFTNADSNSEETNWRNKTEIKKQKKNKAIEGWNRKSFKVIYGEKQRVKILKIKRKRNKKLKISENTKKAFENWFCQHYNNKHGPYPNKSTRLLLAKKTNTPELQVQRWFGQRRRIEKERWENGEIEKPLWI
ncbi:homeobox protein transcription factor [Anaeramoeba flamelloides]|uniref:Homeobox protein transcription factor n=1 Tax=Anaeramoeba flamelloides TaxID=1746091 RepID=A0AAV7YDQ7_9EUKA|nr:homeobox protein transcription factor [Anaeramoeba flamelloides]